MTLILNALRIFAVLTVLTGALYPLAVTGVGWLCFRHQANGGLVVRDGKTVGSSLLAQKFESDRYFWPRPSSADFATVASGASNKGPTSADLTKAIDERRAKFGADAPAEMLTASGSGLDPHLSPAAAKHQAPRIAAERKIAIEKVNDLIDELTTPPQFGFLGEPRVNVLALNLALDAAR
jgi:K+-transporting ATPase ATPase C chain